MRSLALLAVFLVAGCGHTSRQSKKPEKVFPPLVMPPPTPPPPELTLNVTPILPGDPEYVIPRAKFLICWLWDREDGIYAYPDERMQEVDLTLDEARRLGIPQDVWFFALNNPEMPAIFLLKRLKS